jgi:transglutaminase-like putative cysteine protease
MRILFAVSLCLFVVISQPLAAKTNQPKIKYGDVSVKDFEPKLYAVDSSADAVYLYDVGSSSYEGNTTGSFDVALHKHARIRLLKKSSFDNVATVEIRLFKDGTFEEKLADLDAATYNLENGKVVATKVDKSSVFKDKSENYIILKFTFPNIKEGSIIEYDYKVNSPSYRYIDPWYFQGDYPRLWSEYNVTIPAFYDFVTLKQGYISFVIDSSDVYSKSYNIVDRGTSASDRSESYSFQSGTIYHKWAAENIPALKEEEFTTTLRNHIAKIEFQLSSIRYPDQPVRLVIKDWFEAAADLMKNEYFGEPLTHENNWLDDDVKKATAGSTEKEEKIKNIFEFVKSNYTCTDDYAQYLSQTLKKTYQAKKGNVADVNILLAAMLKNAGFEVHPVLLSTRDYGKPYELYPIMSKFNYVITQVKEGDKSYLLDASDPSNAFNRLPLQCYNGTARVIAELPALIDLSADSVTESKVTTVFMMNDEKGISASFSSQLGTQESQSIRRKLKKTTQEDFFKDMKKSYSMDVELANTNLDSLKKPEYPVTIKYDMSFNTGDEDLFYFSPLLAESYKENPFKAVERLYPVEMDACTNETYILNMEVPKGYKVEEMPKSTRVMLNEDEGMFEYIIGLSGDHLQLRCRTIIKKATFFPEDYATLRDFFAYIVKKEAEQIVFKKQ